MVDEVNDGGTNKFSNLEEETGATTGAKRVERPKPELQPLDKVNHGEREREPDKTHCFTPARRNWSMDRPWPGHYDR